MYKNKKTFKGMAEMLNSCKKYHLTDTNSVLIPPANYAMNGQCTILYNKKDINR